MLNFKTFSALVLPFLLPLAALAVPAMEWSHYQEPAEQAFNVDYPKGWHIEGGTGRVTASTVKPWLRTTSADGATSVFIGDPNAPRFMTPSQINPAGKTIQAPAGALQFQPYETGKEYAQSYGAKLLPAGAENIKLVSSTDEPQLVNKGVAPPNMTITAGSATFSFDEKGKKKIGCIIATTALNGAPSGVSALWSPIQTHGYYTNPGNEKTARELVEYIRTTNKPNSAWLDTLTKARDQDYQNASQALQQNNQNFTNWSNTQNQNFNNWSRSSFQASQDRINSIGNVSRMQAQAQSDWHDKSMANHRAQMGAKDWNRYNQVLNIQNKHLEWDPTTHQNVEVPNY